MVDGLVRMTAGPQQRGDPKHEIVFRLRGQEPVLRSVQERRGVAVAYDLDHLTKPIPISLALATRPNPVIRG